MPDGYTPEPVRWQWPTARHSFHIIRDMPAAIDRAKAWVEKFRQDGGNQMVLMLDKVEKASRDPEQKPTPSQEAWDGLVNLIGTKAPEEEIQKQAEVFERLRDQQYGVNDGSQPR